jgi:hypothetical protein
MMYDLRNGHFEGQLFLALPRPVATRAADGTFNLTLRAFSRPSAHVVTPWLIKWAGDAALGFWVLHGSNLLSGMAINVDCCHLTVMDGAGRNAGAEIYARAMLIELASQSTDAGSQAEPATV